MLAIDGGNSKTDVALVDLDGTVLGAAHGPGTPMEAARFEASSAVLDQLVTEAARQAGLDPTGRLAEHVAAFHAGLDTPEDEQRLLDTLVARGWSGDIRVGNDTFAVLRAGTVRPWGVGVTCGAGINCVAIGPDGSSTRFLALGRFTGDWGGGMDLGYEVMWWAMRAEDGRGEPTELRSAVAAHFGLASMHEVALAVHLGKITGDDLIRLTYVLFEVADAGDGIACALVDRLADEISLMALVAMRRLRLVALDTEVVLGGGLLTAGNTRLTDGIETRIRAKAPNARIGVAELPPITGAVLLGLDHLGVTPTS